jgi:hypothetical protein
VSGGRSAVRGGGRLAVAWLVVRSRWGLAEAPGGLRLGVGEGGRAPGREGWLVGRARRQVGPGAWGGRGAADRGRVGEPGRGGRGYGVGGFLGGSAQVREPGWGSVRRGVRRRCGGGRCAGRRRAGRRGAAGRTTCTWRTGCTSGPACRVAGHARRPVVAAHAVPAGPWRARRVLGCAARAVRGRWLGRWWGGRARGNGGAPRFRAHAPPVSSYRRRAAESVRRGTRPSRARIPARAGGHPGAYLRARWLPLREASLYGLTPTEREPVRGTGASARIVPLRCGNRVRQASSVTAGAADRPVTTGPPLSRLTGRPGVAPPQPGCGGAEAPRVRFRRRSRCSDVFQNPGGVRPLPTRG